MDLKISVCIPAYNRSEVLDPLLKSIVTQDYSDYEIVVCEDNSPERQAIRAIVQEFIARHQGRVRYFENEKNIGYDANLRNLLEKADGDYCFFMGNDDLMCPGALSTVASALKRYENIGVILRSYASFEKSPGNIVQVFKYFDKELFFPAGTSTITTFYRRSVVIPGVVIHRKKALECSTDRFDGTLLYQLHLIANILVDMNGVFLPEILALYRTGGTPDFGNSEKEEGRFVPREQTPESSLHFVKGMLDIAAWAEKSRDVKIYKPILSDIGNYSYPILSIQSRKALPVYLKYSYRLAGMGFWKNRMFYLYFFSILLLGANNVDKLIRFIKDRIGYTPAIGKIYKGQILVKQ